MKVQIKCECGIILNSSTVYDVVICQKCGYRHEQESEAPKELKVCPMTFNKEAFLKNHFYDIFIMEI